MARKSTSSAEDPFLQMILENPDDDMPRLVFADWLEERGDPRGTFIRLQCQRSGLTPHDAGFKELLAQEALLFRQYEAEWSKPVLRLVDAVEFRRGFIEHVTVSATKFLKNADRLFRLAPVRSVRLTLLDFLLLRIAACPHLAKVKQLDLSHNHTGTGSDMLQILVNSSFINQMTLLDLTDCHLGSAAAAVLANTPNLAHLQTLRLGRNLIGEVGARSIASSTHLTQLRELNLYVNGLLAAGAVALAATQTMRLTHLDVGMNRIGNEGCAAIANSSLFADLRRLDLRNNAISNVGVEAIVRSPYLSRLEHLELENNRISDRGVEALAASTTLSIVYLDLEVNEFGPAAAKVIANSPNFPRMRHLWLGQHGAAGKK